jgi:hypothetical protein
MRYAQVMVGANKRSEGRVARSQAITSAILLVVFSIDAYSAHQAGAPGKSVRLIIGAVAFISLVVSLVLMGRSRRKPSGPGFVSADSVAKSTTTDVDSQGRAGEEVLLLGGVDSIDGFMQHHGLRFELEKVGAGSGGAFARGALVNGECRISISCRRGLGDIILESAGKSLPFADYL